MDLSHPPWLPVAALAAVGQARCFAVPVVALGSKVLVSANDKAPVRDSARLAGAATVKRPPRQVADSARCAVALVARVAPRAALNVPAQAPALKGVARRIARRSIKTIGSCS